MWAQQLAKLTDSNTQSNLGFLIHLLTSLQAKKLEPSSIHLQFEGQDLIEGKVYALSSDIKNVDPALRLGKDTTSWSDLTKCLSDQKGKSLADLSKPAGSVPMNVVPQQQVTPPTNPIDRSNGCMASILSETPSKTVPEIDMKDGMKKPSANQSPQYHFTSDIQDLANPQFVYDEIMNQKVTLPVYQVIGSSPALQKLVGEATWMKRVYTSKHAEYSFSNTDHSTEHIDIQGNVAMLLVKNRQADNFDRIQELYECDCTEQ